MGNINKGNPTLFHKTGKPYTAVSNAVVESINNTDALAIWTFLQTKSNGWNVIGSYLMDKFGIGRKRYADAMKYLADMGLIEYVTSRNDLGQVVGKRIVVNYEPSTEVAGNRHVGKPTVRSNNSSVNKQLPIKDSLPINRSLPINESTPLPQKGDKAAEAIPATAIHDLYNKICTRLPTSRGLSPKRRDQIKARWKEDAERQNLDWWKSFFEYVNESDFLANGLGSWKGANLEWITNANNMVKIIEGQYENE